MSNLNNNEEVFGGRRVHPNIVCKICIFAKGPAPFADDPQKVYCIQYPRGGEYGGKPNSVYFDGEDCEFHRTKEEQAAVDKRRAELLKKIKDDKQAKER